MDNVEFFVDLKDGSRWSATIITLARVEILMKRWAASGEPLAGRYFWCSDGLIVRDAGISNMIQILAGLIQNGEFTQILQRLDGCLARSSHSETISKGGPCRSYHPSHPGRPWTPK